MYRYRAYMNPTCILGIAHCALRITLKFNVQCDLTVLITVHSHRHYDHRGSVVQGHLCVCCFGCCWYLIMFHGLIFESRIVEIAKVASPCIGLMALHEDMATFGLHLLCARLF